MSMSKVIRTIRKNKKFLITTHINPDPDALCSELALAIFLRSLGKSVTMVNHEPVPPRFDFLPGVRRIKSYQDVKRLRYDAAIVVDCGDLGRTGKVRNLLDEKKILINIDHHITNDSFGDVNLVKPAASSTAEVLYDLFCEAKCAINKSLAMHLYIGIMTDTGSFRYENTTARTHEIVAELLEHKISTVDVYRRLYELISFNDLKEFLKVVSTLKMHFAGKVVCVQLPKNVVAKFSGDFDLKDAIFKFLRSINNVEAFVILTEIDTHRTRVNLRSVRRLDVAKLANAFQGGGHRRASGCVIPKGIPQAQKDVLAKIRKVL